MDKSILPFLQLAEPFHELDESQLHLLIHYGELIQFNHHEMILLQGKPGPGLFLLLQGKVHISVKAMGKGVIQLATLNPGQFFGEVNLIEHGLCTATVKAQGNVTCYFLSKAVYEMFMIGFPTLHYKISAAVLRNSLKRQRDACNTIGSHTAIRRKINLAQHTRKPARHILKWNEAEKIAALNYLMKLPIFQIFNKNEFLQLIAYSNVIEAYSHFALITAGSNTEACYFILKGSGMIQIPTKRDDISISTLSPNRWLCATCLIDQKPNIYHIRVGTEGQLLEFNQAALALMQETDQTLWFKLHTLLCQANIALQKKTNTQIIRMSYEENDKLTRGAK